MIFFTKKPLKDDSLRIVRILSIDILKLRFVRILLKATLIFQAAMTLIQIYFFCCVLTLMDFVKYSPMFFGMFYVIMENNFYRNRIIFFFNYSGNITLKNLKPWALDSGDNKTTAKIKTESVFWTSFVFVNFGLALIAASLFVLPVRNDKDVFFALYLFDRYFSEYASILNWVYRWMVFIQGFTMVNCSHLFLYIVEHILFQVNLLLSRIAGITNVSQYDSEDESSLLKNEHYQMEVENRIKFCIKRHVDLRRVCTEGVTKLQKWIPTFSLNGILLFICCIVYFFLNDDNPKGRYYRVGAAVLTGLTTFCSMIFVGQSVENETDVLHLINTKIRWSSLNRSNLKLLMIMTLMTKKPFSLKFSNNIIVNYALGVKIVKLVYSVVCFLVQMKQFLH
ncbi:uncharacterized protein [Tenebrio molitor]|uniref:uncharacterized protein n=1 Tax=Tenebrio molitor TaxID=7067 RepID=UPI0036249FCD